MVTYRIAQSVLDEQMKARVLSVIAYYTRISGGIDVDKVNTETLRIKFGITIAEAKAIVGELITEGKVEVV